MKIDRKYWDDYEDYFDMRVKPKKLTHKEEKVLQENERLEIHKKRKEKLERQGMYLL